MWVLSIGKNKVNIDIGFMIGDEMDVAFTLPKDDLEDALVLVNYLNGGRGNFLYTEVLKKIQI